MQKIGEDVIQREVEAFEEQRQGLVLITIGNVLLCMDLLLACFVYSGLQAGSYMFLWWVLGEGVLGLGMVGVGFHKKSDARRKLAELTLSRHS